MGKVACSLVFLTIDFAVYRIRFVGSRAHDLDTLPSSDLRLCVTP